MRAGSRLGVAGPAHAASAASERPRAIHRTADPVLANRARREGVFTSVCRLVPCRWAVRKLVPGLRVGGARAFPEQEDLHSGRQGRAADREPVACGCGRSDVTSPTGLIERFGGRPRAEPRWDSLAGSGFGRTGPDGCVGVRVAGARLRSGSRCPALTHCSARRSCTPDPRSHTLAGGKREDGRASEVDADHFGCTLTAAYPRRLPRRQHSYGRPPSSRLDARPKCSAQGRPLPNPVADRRVNGLVRPDRQGAILLPRRAVGCRHAGTGAGGRRGRTRAPLGAEPCDMQSLHETWARGLVGGLRDIGGDCGAACGGS
jgi:hypothetical protein